MSTPSITLDPILDESPTPSAPARVATPPSAWRRWGSFMLKATLVVFVLAGISAIGLMIFGWHVGQSDAGSMMVQVDGVTVHDAISRGVVATFGMWVLITVGLVLGFSMVLFGVSASFFIVLAAFSLVGLIGLLMAAPAVLLIALMVWILRRAFGAPRAV